MLRTGTIFAAAMLAIGCASQHRKPTTMPMQASDEPRYEPLAASALSFDPPISFGQYPLALNRDERSPAAVLGFGPAVTSYYYLQVEDHDLGSGRGRYDRDAFTQRVGVSYR